MGALKMPPKQLSDPLTAKSDPMPCSPLLRVPSLKKKPSLLQRRMAKRTESQNNIDYQDKNSIQAATAKLCPTRQMSQMSLNLSSKSTMTPEQNLRDGAFDICT